MVERVTKKQLRAEAKRVFRKIYADSGKNYDENQGRRFEAHVTLLACCETSKRHTVLTCYSDVGEEDARRELVRALSVLERKAATLPVPRRKA